MRLLIVACVVLSVLPGMARAGAPMGCEIDARSAQGGRVWLSKFDHSDKMPFDMPMQLVWQPPSSGDTIEIGVGGEGGGLAELTGGHLSFWPKVSAEAGHYSVRIHSATGEMWAYDGGDLTVGTDQADIVFGGKEGRGAAILAAIQNGTRLTVEIVLAGKVETASTFDPSNVKERDKLVAYANHLVETNDPRVCKPI